MADFSQMKLGKLAPRVDQRTLKLSQYLPVLPPPPDAVDWTSGITDWGMMLNDTLGDCTIAALGHAVQTWTAAIGPAVTLNDPTILQYYSLWDGYVPGDPSTDQGGIELDVLNHWRKEGFSGYKIRGYVDPDVKNTDHIKNSIYLFGGVYIGLSLPIAWKTAEVWDAARGQDGEQGSWGGHAVICNKYNSTGPVCVTWGKLQQMTWAGFDKYCDEAHTILLEDWLTWAPNDYSFLSNLDNDLAALKG